MDKNTGKTREEFFKNCEYVAKAPACIFLEGDRFSKKAKVLPVPLYAYAGIEKGNFERFEYEEFGDKINVESLDEKSMQEFTVKSLVDLVGMPEEEAELVRRSIPVSSWRRHREEYYPLFFEKVIKGNLISKKISKKTALESSFHVENLSTKKIRKIVSEVENDKFTDYFKIKVYSEIPTCSGLNEGAAIATATSFLLKMGLYKNEEYRKEMILDFEREKEKLGQGLVPNKSGISQLDLLAVFSQALRLDFFSNGAAVFASLMGRAEPDKTIDYECMIYSPLRLFFDFHEKKVKQSEPKGAVGRFKKKLEKSLLDSPYYNMVKEMERLDPELRNDRYFAPQYAINLKKMRPEEKIEDYFTLPFTVWKFSNIPFFRWGLAELTEKDKQALSALRQGDKEEIKGVELIREHLPETQKAKGEDREDKSVEDERKEIIFTETEVRISGQQPFSKDNLFILAEYIILKERVHWLWSFVILPKFEVKDPKKQFRNYISKNKGILKENGIKIVALKKIDDDYAILESIEDSIKLNIRDVKDCFVNAISFFEQHKLKEAIDELSNITKSRYKWYSFTEAYLKLIEWIRMNSFEGISEQLMIICRDFSSWYSKRLRVGLSRIECYNKKLSRNKNKLDALAEEELKKIKEESRKVEDDLRALIQKSPLSSQDMEYENFVKFLIDIQDKIKYVMEQEAVSEEKRQEFCIQVIIKSQDKNEHFNGLIKDAFEKIGNKMYELDKRAKRARSDRILQDESKEVYWLICELLFALENFDVFEFTQGSKLGLLISYFTKGMEDKINKWLSARL